MSELGKAYSRAVFAPITLSAEDEGKIHHLLIEKDPDYRKRWFDRMARTLAIDFDGVLHPYTEGWVGPVPAPEPPMPGAEDFLRQATENGYRLVVFSTRCDTPQGLAGTKAWLAEHGLDSFIEEVSCQKPAAIAYIDDRAVSFRGDWDLWAEIERLREARPHGAAQPVVSTPSVEQS